MAPLGQLGPARPILVGMEDATIPYGRWPSRLDSATAASLKISVSTLRSWHDELFWIEGRPELKGRRVVTSWDQERPPKIVSPDSISLTSRVHEYGGGAMDVLDASGPLIVGVREDQALISLRPGDDAPHVIALPSEGLARGGLFAIDGTSWVAMVEETLQGGSIARRIVAYDVFDGSRSTLVSGRDFYADVAVRADRGELAWCCWDHPSMPWEAGEIWSAALFEDAGGLRAGLPEHVAGGPGRPASSPSYGDDGALLYLCQEGDWSRPWSRPLSGSTELLSPAEHDFGGPMWTLGNRQILSRDKRAFSIEHIGGFGFPVALSSSENRVIDRSALSVDELCITESSVAWISPTTGSLATVTAMRTDLPDHVTSVRLGPAIPLLEGDIATARSVTGSSRHGGAVHGLLYLPTSSTAKGPHDERPPVVVFCHGGPTAAARPGFDPIIQSMTNRGFAVVAANYAGSSGYGATYRHRLDAAWGLLDVDDCVDLVSSLGAQGLVDPTRAGIRGGSAGGFTALLGLTTGAFRCAVSWYGVADLVTLAASTHDFESRYLDSLVGPLPEQLERYRDRSPVNRAPEMQGAVLLLQGLDDPVVPPDQARSMAAALERNGHVVELLEFEGESHGFRRLETLTACLDAEIGFYQAHLCQGFDQSDH